MNASRWSYDTAVWYDATMPASKKQVRRKKRILAGEEKPDMDRVAKLMELLDKMGDVLAENMDGVAVRPASIPAAMCKLAQCAREVRELERGSPETLDDIVVIVPGLTDD